MGRCPKEPREQADGSLYISYGAEIHQVYAKEEPLGLRMVLDGVTVLLPTIYDLSELRSDITGKSSATRRRRRGRGGGSRSLRRR